MFGLGFWEIMVIFLVIVIFINPKDLPGFFNRVGKVYRNMRDMNRTIVHKLNEAGKEELSGKLQKNININKEE